MVSFQGNERRLVLNLRLVLYAVISFRLKLTFLAMYSVDKRWCQGKGRDCMALFDLITQKYEQIAFSDGCCLSMDYFLAIAYTHSKLAGFRCNYIHTYTVN